MALMSVDLDGFKQVNDKYGHEAGDLVLEEVGQRMVCSTRTTDTIARVGGDEFMVVLTNVKVPAAISRVATKMLNKIKKPYHFKEFELLLAQVLVLFCALIKVKVVRCYCKKPIKPCIKLKTQVKMTLHIIKKRAQTPKIKTIQLHWITNHK